eukprot:2536911-Lingulodinium_polyedra.AAC.1
MRICCACLLGWVSSHVSRGRVLARFDYFVQWEEKENKLYGVTALNKFIELLEDNLECENADAYGQQLAQFKGLLPTSAQAKAEEILKNIKKTKADD